MRIATALRRLLNTRLTSDEVKANLKFVWGTPAIAASTI
jgi:hypothetical protein